MPNDDADVVLQKFLPHEEILRLGCVRTHMARRMGKAISHESGIVDEPRRDCARQFIASPFVAIIESHLLRKRFDELLTAGQYLSPKKRAGM
jgi:hypothetical protein